MTPEFDRFLLKKGHLMQWFLSSETFTTNLLVTQFILVIDLPSIW